MRSINGPKTACANCGALFRSIYGPRKYCSHSCYSAVARAKRVNETNGTAKCAKCKEWKPLPDFVKGHAGRPHSYCKECSRAWFTARRRRLGARPKTPTAIARQNAKEYKRYYNKAAHHIRRAAGKFPGKHEIGRMLCDQDAKCAYCRMLLPTGFHIDHKKPVARGGTNDITNLHITCPTCNMRKGAMTHEEFLVSKSRRAARW